MSKADSYETLPAWFLSVARDQPEAVAIDHSNETMTYGELAELAQSWAGWLGTVTPGERLGLTAHRNLRTFALYLAIMMAGRAVVPLGPQSPAARLLNIVRSSGVEAVLTTDPLDATTQSLVSAGVSVHACPPKPSSGVRGAGAAALTGEHIAYILHTSGTTGAPKGVPIRHRMLLSFIKDAIDRYSLGPGARLSANFALTFDPSLHDFFGAICSGATMVLPRGRETLAPATYVNQRGLTHWYSVPSVISASRNIGLLPRNSMPDLRWSLFIGEPLRLDLCRSWRAAAPSSIIENVYGPTEMTLACSQYRLPQPLDEWPSTSNGTVPIGKPLPGTEWRLKESELLLRGPQRFDGYIDPQDSAGRFIDDADQPVHPVSGAVPVTAWYRTGDLVSVEETLLVHRGRSDRQVKVRGHRVELAEVENALREAAPQLRDAAAVVMGEHEQSSIHVALVGSRELEKALLRAVELQLPAHMVPAQIVWLDALPLGATGKVDYAAIVRHMLEQSDVNRADALETSSPLAPHQSE